MNVGGDIADRLRRFGWYALFSAVVAAGLAAGVGALSGVWILSWLAAGVAYGVQLVAFLVLVLVYGRGRPFVLGWVLGTVIRFGALLGLVAWVVLAGSEHPALLLLTLVGVLVVLVLIEPLFLRQRREKR